MAESVVSEGQWSIVQYLKPVPGFERVYQGKPALTPIAFPGELDLYAQKKIPGYDPDLLSGFPVPLGSRVRIWIPLTISGGDVSPAYQYQIIWRMRTITDFITGQGTGQVDALQSYPAYHIGVGPFGQPETIDSSHKLNRYFLPGGMQTALFPQPQPTAPNAGTPGVLQIQGQVLQPVATAGWIPPLTPAGREAAWQQGVYPDTNTLATGPTFVNYEFDALGDELSILATRIGATEDTLWDFTTTEDSGDKAFSTTYGNNAGTSASSPFTAILIMVGTR